MSEVTWEEVERYVASCVARSGSTNCIRDSYDQTNEISELATALAEASKKIGGAVKDSKNPHLGNRYADLKSVIEATRPHLAEVGLTIQQHPIEYTEQRVSILTILLHKSGQFTRSVMSMPVPEGRGVNVAQRIGMALSYLRRYAWSAITGIYQEDLDAEVWSGGDRASGSKPEPHNNQVAEAASLEAMIRPLQTIDDAGALEAYAKKSKPRLSKMSQAAKERFSSVYKRRMAELKEGDEQAQGE